MGGLAVPLQFDDVACGKYGCAESRHSLPMSDNPYLLAQMAVQIPTRSGNDVLDYAPLIVRQRESWGNLELRMHRQQPTRSVVSACFGHLLKTLAACIGGDHPFV